MMAGMESYRNRGPQRKEITYRSGHTEVYWSCGSCMSIMIEGKCLHCSKGHKTEEEKAAMSEAMDKLVAEYNQLTGKCVKRFASLEIGQQRLERAKFEKDNPNRPKPPKPEAPKKAKRKNVNMSEKAKDSWDNKEVAAARGKRSSCTVDGVVYRTIGEAFDALKLPGSKFIPFRKQLKIDGKGDFTHNGKVHKFTITDYQPKNGDKK